MKIKRILAFVFATVALVLECLPYGAVLRFANPDGEPWRKTYSYFDPTPFGYGNFSPLFTAILTVLLVIMLILLFLREKEKRESSAFLLSMAASLFSVCPVTGGIHYCSPVGVASTLCLAASTALLWRKDLIK